MAANTMPAAFIGHGTPRITFETNVITETWRRFAASIPRPESILVISAHWYINASAVTAMERPRTIHDFFYGPEALYRFEYPAPGSPELAQRVIDLVAPTWLGPDIDSWGFDHGVWALLAHLYPEADIPVVQLSVNAAMPPEYHVELGAQLTPLRSEGVLVLASGNIVHNGYVSSPAGRSNGDYDRARAFDDRAAEVIAERPSEAAKLTSQPGYELAAPTPDHFLPLLYLAGIAIASEEVATPLLRGADVDSLGMSAHVLGAA